MVKMLKELDLSQEIHVYEHKTLNQTMAAHQARIAEQDRKSMERLQQLLDKINKLK